MHAGEQCVFLMTTCVFPETTSQWALGINIPKAHRRVPCGVDDVPCGVMYFNAASCISLPSFPRGDGKINRHVNNRNPSYSSLFITNKSFGIIGHRVIWVVLMIIFQNTNNSKWNWSLASSSSFFSISCGSSRNLRIFLFQIITASSMASPLSRYLSCLNNFLRLE